MVNTLRVDFYVLPDQKENGRALLMCRLAHKAYSCGHTVYILAASEAQAAALDDLLWTFRQDSFIPHERYPATGTETPGEATSPVFIGITLPVECTMQVLINYTDTVPVGFERYERVVEVVDQHPAILAAARKRFQYYREEGCVLETHKL